nr:hypothetical protein [Citrobacter amalonaticus]
MKVTPKVTRTIPELDRADTIMFSTADGDLRVMTLRKFKWT